MAATDLGAGKKNISAQIRGNRNGANSLGRSSINRELIGEPMR